MWRHRVGAAVAMVWLLAGPAAAHRDGCHRWHSCPSDRGTYVCGDLGYTSECGPPAPRFSAPAAAPTGRYPLRTTTANVNLRVLDHPERAPLALLPRGTVVELVVCRGAWCMVVARGQVGQVARQYLR